MKHSTRNISEGDKFGRLTVIKIIPRVIGIQKRVLCVCECGNKTKSLSAHSVMSGGSKSCGCYKKDVAIIRGKNSRKHGMCFSKEYSIWKMMKTRCLQKTHARYKSYGAVGITVCHRWLKFENFFEDMGNCPTKKHTLDRKNGKLGYSKYNCRWATSAEQNRNRSSNHWITFKGEKLCLMDWSLRCGIEFHTLGARIKRGWDFERAITQKVFTRRPRCA